MESKREIRLQKLTRFREAGFRVFQEDFRPTHTTAACRRLEEKLSGETVRLAGRLRAIRRHGKATFADLWDADGRLQLLAREDRLGEKYALFRLLDLGDIIGVEGTLFRTRTGELTLEIQDFRLLTKSLREPPEKFHGLRDPEARFRHRYLDLFYNPEARHTILARDFLLHFLRSYFRAQGFLEVETPLLQPIPGGAEARPFRTHHHALDLPLYLRIAPELYLKRLMVAQFDRIFELGRVFRNEGISRRHNPEFTMLEAYWAYASYREVMDLVENLLKSLFAAYERRFPERAPLRVDGAPLAWRKPFPRRPFWELMRQHAGVGPEDFGSEEQARRTAERLGISTEEYPDTPAIVDEVFKEFVEPHLKGPLFVVDHPRFLSPLARAHPEQPDLVERFELFIGGMEIVNAFSELTDPLEQRARFEEQIARRGEGQLDEDFLEALEFGMPPTGGLGIGVDRLLMVLCGQNSIREVLAFPLLRPRAPSKMLEGGE